MSLCYLRELSGIIGNYRVCWSVLRFTVLATPSPYAGFEWRVSSPLRIPAPGLHSQYRDNAEQFSQRYMRPLSTQADDQYRGGVLHQIEDNTMLVVGAGLIVLDETDPRLLRRAHVDDAGSKSLSPSQSL